MLETVDHPMPTTLTQAYAMKAHEDQDAPSYSENKDIHIRPTNYFTYAFLSYTLSRVA